MGTSRVVSFEWGDQLAGEPVCATPQNGFGSAEKVDGIKFFFLTLVDMGERCLFGRVC